MRIHYPTDDQLARMPGRTYALEVNGSTTRVWEYGPADATTTVVVVHGFRGTHHGLLPVIAQLGDVRWIAPDLPGFGESGPLPTGHALDDYAAWLRAFLAAIDPDAGATVIGHSFGSLVVARKVAGLAPRRIILINPIARAALEGPAVLGTKLAVFYYWLGATLPEPIGNALLRNRLITRVMSEVMAVTRSRSLRAWIHREHDRHFSSFHDRVTLLEAFRASVSDAVGAHASELPVGTVLIAGERDLIAPVETQYELAAAAPGATLHVIEGVGHLVHYETPVAAARIIADAVAMEAATEAATDAATEAARAEATDEARALALALVQAAQLEGRNA